jgi:hypothetical protein
VEGEIRRGAVDWEGDGGQVQSWRTLERISTLADWAAMWLSWREEDFACLRLRGDTGSVAGGKGNGEERIGCAVALGCGMVAGWTISGPVVVLFEAESLTEMCCTKRPLL